jgi:hypothetical protein
MDSNMIHGQRLKIQQHSTLTDWYHLMGTRGVPDLLSGSIGRQHDTNDPVSDRQDPRPQSKHHVISWLSIMCYPIKTSPRRLSAACISKNTSKSKEEHNSIAEILGLSTRMWGFTNRWTATIQRQIQSKQNPTLTRETATEYKGLGSSKKP